MTDMTSERREKLLGRLRKCLALSASPEPHEAAAAIRQAQALMKALGLESAEDLLALTIDSTLVKTREGFGACRTVGWLSQIICEAFAVTAINECNPGSARRLNIRYIGPQDRVLLAEYSHKVVWRAMEASWKAYLDARPDLKSKGGARQSFHIGWLMAVRKKIEAIAPTVEESKGIEVWIGKFYNAPLRTVDHSSKKLDGTAYGAGSRAAADFTLHRPVEGSATPQAPTIGHEGSK